MLEARPSGEECTGFPLENRGKPNMTSVSTHHRIGLASPFFSLPHLFDYDKYSYFSNNPKT